MAIAITQGVINSVLRGVKTVLEGRKTVCESEVRKIEESMSTLRDLLLGVDEHMDDSHPLRRLLDAITEVVYVLDDLLDKLVVLTNRSKHIKHAAKVCWFFSPSVNPYAILKSLKIIQGKLRSCIEILRRFDFGPDHVVSYNRRRLSSCSFLSSRDVIGRDSDLGKILKILLSYEDGDGLRFLSIVGIGGIGKTTLAQLVYNSREAINAFLLKLWVHVGDAFDLKSICASIIESATGRNAMGTMSMDQVLVQVYELLVGKRFLLVLDDVWTENADDWRELQKLLMAGGSVNDSCILITTQSKKTASMAGTGRCHVYELGGLSKEDSWRLFQMTAFDRDSKSDSQLVEIGKNIVARTSNVPLALRRVGALLYGQDRQRWLTFEKRIPDNALDTIPGIIPVLLSSYEHLEPLVKCCFTFCALFPKDFKIRTDLLISLWIAQGYIEPSPIVGESLEDVAIEYFMTLIRRCFFQDVETDEYGDVVSCRIHDLMHELARKVAGEQINVVDVMANISARTIHVLHDGKKGGEASFTKMHIRTYLQSGFHGQFPVARLFVSCKSLRALSLHDLDDRSLPESIRDLIHLRYLDLSRNKSLEMLPKSLTKLFCLETLDLRDCSKLKELPSDLSKLLLLRRLDIFGCELLTCMPSKLNNLTRLRTLSSFVVDDGDSSGKLEDLKALHNLKGSIEILIPANYSIAGRNEIEGHCLREMAHLKAVCIHFRGSGSPNRHSALLEKLQPHQNLVGLTLKGYQGLAIHWEASIQNLSKLELISCESLLHLPSLSKLVFLKSLVLHKLVKLEYMEGASSVGASADPLPGSNELAPLEFYPLLEYLDISGLCNLKAWWGRMDSLDVGPIDGFKSRQQSFPRLYHLKILNCPKLASFPPCPNVEKLCVAELNAKLSILGLCPDWHLMLKELTIDDICYFKSLLTSHERVHSSTHLRNLKIEGSVKQFTFEESPEDDGPWKLLHQNLCTLELDSLEKMVNLPEGMHHLTALKQLTISHCHNLRVIPEWISCLTSLESLCIRFCSGLKSLPESMRKLTSLRHLEILGHTYLQKRCQPIHGEDWPKIRHIQSIILRESS